MTQDIHAEKILILDFGSQYTQLIARRVREANVYCEIYAWDVADHYVQDFAPNGIILSGGPESVTAENGPRAPQAVWALGVPVLGICYGMQTMAAQLGGEVDLVEAHFWFNRASIGATALNQERVKKAIEHLEMYMEQDTVSAAKTRFKDYLDGSNSNDAGA